MRTLVSTAASLFLIALFTSPVKAQQVFQKEIVLFPTGKAIISTNYLKKLDVLVEKIKNNGNISVKLEGNTDNVGTDEYNRILSDRRAQAVKDYLVEAGIRADLISVSAFGRNNPVATNETSEGRQQNRRVDISIVQTEPVDVAVENLPPDNISDLYKLLQTPLQEFCIYRNRDTAVRCKQGTVIYIKANALLQAANCNNNCVTFRVREDLLKSDMILDNLSTTSNGEIIETQGMIYTEAVDCNGTKVPLQNGKDLVIVLPIDTVNAEAKIFKGRRNEDSVMNWTVDTTAVLSSARLVDLNECGNFLCAPPDQVIPCSSCRFFFCRIGRIGKGIGGIFSKSQRSKNIEFNQCQIRLRQSEDAFRRAVSPTIPGNCEMLKQLLLRYGVKDPRELLEKINKPLMDRYNVKTIEELTDTLAKLEKEEVELAYRNKQISLTDLQLYIYNTRDLGWSNVDIFAKIPASRKTNVKVNLESFANMDCKLVFKRRNIVLPATKTGKYYQFFGVPKDEPAILVVIKNENGRPFLAMKDILVSNTPVDVEFKELTLEQLKEQLKRLD